MNTQQYQQPQKPVAYQERQSKTICNGVVTEWSDWYSCEYTDISELRSKSCNGLAYEWRPLFAYTQPQYQTLTDEEIAEAVGDPIDSVYLADFRKVESKLREKNHAVSQRKPLSTDDVWNNDELMKLNAVMMLPMDYFMRVVRAIEAAHGIKE